MKKRLVLALGLLLSAQVFGQADQTVMEIDGKKVTKSEFLQIYLKNNNNPKYDKQALDEYMEELDDEDVRYSFHEFTVVDE